LVADGTGFLIKNYVMFGKHREVSETVGLGDHPLLCVNAALTEGDPLRPNVR
jgi:hypothetical protein